MTQGGWGGNPFDTNTAGQNPFAPPGPPTPGYTPPPPQPPPSDSSVLATLSVVFAFFFAPAGAVLGHLALGQHDTRSRDRALVGVTLSYTFLVTALVATAVWAVQGRLASAPPVAATPVTTTVTSTTSSPPPPPPAPTVAPADLSNLLPTLDEVRTIVNGPELNTTSTSTELPSSPEETDSDQAMGDCAGAVNGTRNLVYIDNRADATFVRTDATKAISVNMAVTSFPDVGSAQLFTTQTIEVWRRCVGQRVVQAFPNGQHTSYDIGNPSEADGITTLRNTATMPNNAVGSEFLVTAAKANVAVELLILSQFGTADQATALARRILDRIPS
ncbi:sensor domain-containing protein [Mycobacterium sp. M1]|uniref:Sensor domain-containing protein n=1 Tax=Mycolicibacter acidiphilus TaxID=2835306 RepID=A0ABS5RHE7_9MYCO|nr:sensor domain-containing protein [Mycolicibacter acidiphilus]MBS9533427.1 sensor domain-containing protein [Mycolicibacter acidiphilus]